MTHMNASIRPFQDEDEAAVVGGWHRSGQAAYAFLPLWQTLTLDHAGKIFREVVRIRCNIWVGTLEVQVVAYLASEWRKGWGTRLVDFARAFPRTDWNFTHIRRTIRHAGFTRSSVST